MSNIPATEIINSVVSRVERLQADRDIISTDIAEVYKEAKSAGLSVPVLRGIVRDRGKDPQKLREDAELRDLYMAALESGKRVAD